MQNFIIGVIIFFAVILQTSFLSIIFPFSLVPDIVLVFIIIWTARSDFGAVLKWAILGGLMMDLASFYPVGINIFSFVTIAFIVHSLSKRFLIPQMAWKFMVLLIIVFVATAINEIISEFIINILNQKTVRENIQQIFADRLIWKSFYNVCIFVIIYWPIRTLDKFFSYRNQRVVVKRHA